MPDHGAFEDLRRLSDWFTQSVEVASRTNTTHATLGSSTNTSRATLQFERLARRLGTTAVPLLGRELRDHNPIRREIARRTLAMLAATPARTRIIVELRSIAADGSGDEAKVSALGLLAELGEHAAARFSDPTAIQRRSALALAAQLETPGDVASAADLMVRQLDDRDVMQMLEILVEAAPEAAYRLATELAGRLDLDDSQREHVTALLADTPTPARDHPAAARPARPTHAAVLVDGPRPTGSVSVRLASLVEAAARIVVVASRKVNGQRRWRRWAVLIGTNGRIDDCLYEDDARRGDGDDAAGLIASLCADGYRVASNEIDHARTVVEAAIRRTSRSGDPLASAYYLGRDLLDLRDAHVVRPAPEASTVLSRALDLLAHGDPVGARVLLDRSTGIASDPQIAAAIAACLCVQGEIAAAIEPLERAIAGEPAWPLHHWNHAVALHRLGDRSGCYHALRRFVATSDAPGGLSGDPDQPGRVAIAARMVAQIERSARLSGVSLARPRRRRVRT